MNRREGGGRTASNLARRTTAALLSTLMLLGSLVFGATAEAVELGDHNGSLVNDKPASWTPHVLDGYVAAFAEIGNKIVVGGNFQQVRTASDPTPINKPYIFVVEKNSGAITSFSADLNGEVTSLVPTGDGESVFVGGGFSSVNGQTVRSLVKLNINTGQRVSSFNPPSFNGRVHDIALRNGKLFVSGRFTTVANQPHTLFAAVDATTGALDPSVKLTFSDPRKNGALSILASDVTPDGSRLVAIGNFTKVNGSPRYQIAQIDLTTTPPSVSNWATNQYGDGCSNSFQSYMRDVEYSPDGSYFVVGTTGAYSSTFLCDTAARWDTNATGTNLMPAWTNYTGGDTLTSVAVVDSVVYLGGHQRRANNPYAADSVGAGSVDRQGLTAVDPRSGATLSWNPGRTRGYGVYGFLATDSGLWIGSDTDRISDFTYKGRMAFMPLAGGKALPTEHTGNLPGQVVSLELITSGIFGTTKRDQVTKRDFNGTVVSNATSENSSTNWRDSRGAFMVDGVLYTGWSNKTLKRQTYDGSSFGSMSEVPLALIPGDSKSLNRFATEDLSTITGMFYDSTSGQIFFTRSGRNVLSRRSFSPESEIVGATRYDSATAAGGVTWSNVRTMFIADGYLYTGDTNGNLYRRVWNSAAGLPTGSATLVSGPSKGDGQKWSTAQDSFVYAPAGWEAPNAAPVAAATVSCSGAMCSLDASASTDADGTIASYSWDFGDGTTPGIGAVAHHVYATSGTYTVTLLVTDNKGATDSVSLTVTVDVPNIGPSASFTTSCVGLDCSFDGSASTDPDGSISSYSWDFGDGSNGSGVEASHTFDHAGSYTVTLTVVDNDGASNARTTQLNVIDPDETPTVDFVGVDSADTNGSTVTLQVPPIANGTKLLLFTTVNNTDALVGGPTGWTQVGTASDATATVQTYLWSREANAADSGSNVTVSASITSKMSAQILAYTGVDSISAQEVLIDTVSHSERTTPTVPVSTPGSRLVSYWADKSSATTNWTLPSGVEQRVQSVGAGNGRIVAAVADSGPLGVGPAGGLTASADSANRRGIVWSVVLSPTTGSANVPPVASFSQTCSNLSCTFDASGSTDPDGTIASYDWSFGDGHTSTGKTVNHAFSSPGSYEVTLTVADNKGADSTTTSTVTVAVTASAPVFRGASEFDGNTSNATPTVPASVQAGDTLVLFTTVNTNSPTITGPAGWTLLGGSNDTSTGIQSFAWTKTAAASDAGSVVSVQASSIAKMSAQILAYSDASGVSASAFSFDSANHADRTTPTVPVAAGGSTLISYWADKNGGANGWSVPTGTQLRSQSIGSGGGLITAAAADTGSLAPGSAGGFTAIADIATRRAVTWSIVISPG